ncbi:MAG: NAD(P)H-binding protein [Pseudomonadota bacterium]|nr:NAD(P)H-binding protein [Pseudomonadota bacterium]
MKKVLLAGASGYVGKHVATELACNGYVPICPGRRDAPDPRGKLNLEETAAPTWDLQNPISIRAVFEINPEIVAVISCVASRTGGVKDSWDVDYKANSNLLKVAKSFPNLRFILLSAICVQKPKLNFQFAKLAFEKELQESNFDFTIVRPTTFFKSLSGQVGRVQKGKRFIVFDTGKKTSTKPISCEDLASFLVQCITSPNSRNKILPIGGPGPALTQKEIGGMIFEALGTQPKFIYLPSILFKVFSTLLQPIGMLSSRVNDIREFMRIAYYYATESMLVWDKDNGVYSSEATPEFGNDTIKSFYLEMVQDGITQPHLGDQSFFK